VLLYQNKKTWLASQENGFEIIKQRYARTLFETNSNENVKHTEKSKTTSFEIYGIIQHHT
jgi:hypothetical protein